jgi:NAD(P)-dependent dehydrogenase (short-subunit alcohol dehydrogenase family)
MANQGWGRLLDDQVAIVTGAAGSIGSACARVMANHGARVLVVDLPDAPVDRTVAEIVDAGGTARAFEGDVSDPDAVDALVDAAVGEWGRLGILVNVAALTGARLAEDRDVVTMSMDSWDRVFAVNLRGAVLCSRRAIPPMLEHGGGAIVNISSNAAVQANTYLCAYSSAKAGLNALTAHIATAYGKRGIRCNAIMPGLVPRSTPVASAQVHTDVEGNALRHTLTTRLGRPDDIANLATYLASDAVAGFITGQVISVDGGAHVHSPSYADQDRATG